MALVPRMLYFLEGLEAACLMAHVVLPAAGRPTIIRIYKKRAGKVCCEIAAVYGMAPPWLAGDCERMTLNLMLSLENESKNNIYLTMLLLEFNNMRFVQFLVQAWHEVSTKSSGATSIYIFLFKD